MCNVTRTLLQVKWIKLSILGVLTILLMGTIGRLSVGPFEYEAWVKAMQAMDDKARTGAIFVSLGDLITLFLIYSPLLVSFTASVCQICTSKVLVPWRHMRTTYVVSILIPIWWSALAFKFLCDMIGFKFIPVLLSMQDVGRHNNWDWEAGMQASGLRMHLTLTTRA
jgi:hypothetical protein